MGKPWLGAAVVVAFQLAFSVAFSGKAVHLDEPAYLAIAGQILRDPWRPMAFEKFWTGRRVSASRMAPNPPAAGYLLAPVLALSGGNERVMRLLLAGFDAAAALFLYLVAARFLKRPLLPTLAVLAGPGWLVTIPSFLPEKWLAAFGFAALYAAARGDPARPDRWWWAAAALSASAALFKYTGAVFPAACAALLAARGAPPARVAAWLGLALAPSAAHLLSGVLEPERLRGVATSVSAAAGTAPSHHARALLAFASGSVPAVLVWAWWGPVPRRALAAAAAAGAALFLPAFDLAPATAADRLLGLALGAGAAAAVVNAAFRRAGDEGWPLWSTLAGLSLFLQAFAYWSVAARFSTFAAAGLALALAAKLEASQPPRKARALAWAGFLASLSLGLPAAATDAAYANASRDAARELAAPAVDAGRPVWFTGHWGLQHYMEAAGARPIEPESGGWERVTRGSLVILPGVNTNVQRPKRLAADVRVAEPAPPFPLLLMCGAGWRCQAGFHSSMYGFLPFSFTREPLDRFELVEPRQGSGTTP
ncbi:MAG: glycosyltransferase family 39 protein [Elusimicrobia bacterium]|nr:glycosyltransferase family 39 protein [Elusimicrobiota bacterium]